MKKIISVFLVVVTLFALCIPAFAADEQKTLESTTVIEDLTNSKYNLDDYPVDKNDDNLYLITVMEYGYKTDNYGLYIYIYNPSCSEVYNSEFNKLQLALSYDSTGKPITWSKYNLLIKDVSADNRFVKIKVKNSSLIEPNILDGTRIYWISGFEMQNVSSDVGLNESGNVRDYDVSYAFSFTGKGSSISCYREDFFTLKLDAHQTSYLTGDSAKGEGYSNQINSVYFSIPQSVEEEYGDLFAVDFEYYKYRTAPIIITDNEESFSCLDDYVGIDLYDYYLFNRISTSEFNRKYFHYKFLIGDLNYVSSDDGASSRYFFADGNPLLSFNSSFSNYFPYYSLLFYVSEEKLKSAVDPDDNPILVCAKDLQDFFVNYDNFPSCKEIPNRSGITVGSNQYNGDLFDLDYFTENYERKNFSLKTKINMKSFADVNNKSKFYYFLAGKWAYVFNKDEYDNSVENVFALKRITSLDFNDSDTTDDISVNDNLLISVDDVAHMQEFCENQEKKNENTYLLHYAWTDDYYSFVCDSNLEGNFLVVQETVYIDFDIISLDFKKGEKITTIAVVSDPSDGFTGIQNTVPNHNLGDNLKEAIDDLFDGSKRDYKSLIMGLVMGLVVVIGVYALINVVLNAGNNGSSSNGTLSKDSQQIHIHNYGARRSSRSYRSKYRRGNRRYRNNRRR